MKKTNILLLMVFFLGFIACKSDYTAPHDDHLNSSGFVRFDEIRKGNVDVTIPDDAFDADIVAPNGNVASYKVFLSLVTADSTYAPKEFTTITSFPNTLKITVQDIVNAFGFFDAGNKVEVTCEVTNTDGTTFDKDDLNDDLVNPGERQALSFSYFGLCPFKVDEAVGQYKIVTEDFGATLDIDRLVTVEKVSDNSVRLVNLFTHPEMYDVVVDVDIESASATVAKQPAWHCDNLGCPYGEGRVDGGGFFFSCAGFLTLDLEHTVDLGSFGTYKLELQKQ